MFMSNNKIIILILSTNNSSYKNFIDTCTNTWVKKARENGIRCIFYTGGGSTSFLKNDNLILDCDDSLAGTAFKLFKAFEFIENSRIEYTHIYRTNLSSFIYMNDFIDFSNSINADFYGGVIGRFNKISILNKFHGISLFSSKILPFQVIEYASGSGFFISRKYIIKVLKSANLNFNYVDDVMIGSVLREENLTKISRFDYTNKLNSNFDDKCFHVRLKTSNREKDASRMSILNSYNNLAEFINFSCADFKKNN